MAYNTSTVTEQSGEFHFQFHYQILGGKLCDVILLFHIQVLDIYNTIFKDFEFFFFKIDFILMIKRLWDWERVSTSWLHDWENGVASKFFFCCSWGAITYPQSSTMSSWLSTALHQSITVESLQWLQTIFHTASAMNSMLFQLSHVKILR